MADEVRTISLISSLREEPWFKVPLGVMRDVGPAVQTFAGFLRVTNKETFCTTKAIADYSMLPVRTTKRHLEILNSHEWVENLGRQRTRRGAPRRTCTRRLTRYGKKAIDNYGVLPWWACGNLRNFGRLKWGTKAVLSIIMSRLMALVSAEEAGEYSESDEEIWGGILNMGGEERFSFSLSKLEELTGLHRETIVEAKLELSKLGIIRWRVNQAEHGGLHGDNLIPNDEFEITITNAGKNQCYIDISGG